MIFLFMCCFFLIIFSIIITFIFFTIIFIIPITTRTFFFIRITYILLIDNLFNMYLILLLEGIRTVYILGAQNLKICTFRRSRQLIRGTCFGWDILILIILSFVWCAIIFHFLVHSLISIMWKLIVLGRIIKGLFLC